MKNIYILLFLLLSSTSFLHAQEYISISNRTQLEEIFNKPTTETLYYRLTDNIIIEGEGNDAWNPKNLINIVFDGNEKTITYKCNNNFALFNKITNSKITRLNLIYSNTPNQVEARIVGGIANTSVNSVISHNIVSKGFNIYPKLISEDFMEQCSFDGGGILAVCDDYTVITNNIFISQNINVTNRIADLYNVYFGGIIGSPSNKNISIYNNISINMNYNNSSEYFIDEVLGKKTSIYEKNSFSKNISDAEISTYILSQKYKILNATDYIDLTEEEDLTIIVINESNFSFKIQSTKKTPVILTANNIKNLTIGKDIYILGNPSTETLIIEDGCILGDHGINYTNYVYYARNPSVWTNKVNGNPNGKGWESLSLPFDAQLITAKATELGINETELYPVGSGKPGSYWLRAFTGVDPENNANVIFQSTSNILKDQAYILSFPGSTFGEDSMEGKNLWFKSKTKEGNIKNHTAKISFGNYTFKNHDLTKTTEDLTKGYFLDSPTEDGWDTGDGCMFLKYEFNANVTPPRSGFRAWLNPISASATPGSLRIVSKPTTSTSLEDNMHVEAIRIYSQDGNLIIESDSVRAIDIFNALNGLKCKTVNLQNGSNTISGLQKGIYIIEGKKVVL